MPYVFERNQGESLRLGVIPLVAGPKYNLESGGSRMNIDNETKGLPGEIPKRNFTGGPFYIEMKLLGIGCVITRPDIKQRSTHYL